MSTAAPSKTTCIRELNDLLRTTFTGGRVLMTVGVAALPEALTARVLQRVHTFDRFDGDNDPHGEHDFGAFEIDGDQFFWKIDLYEDHDVKCQNEEPVVPRVLTIMLAEEY